MSETSQLAQVASCTRDWHWCSTGYEEAGDYLFREILTAEPGNHGGEQIWRTTLKEVFVYRLPEELGGYRVALKTCHEQRFWRYFLRPSLACREAMGFEAVKALGIPVVDVILCGEERNPLHLRRSFFATRFEEGTAQLKDFEPGCPAADCHDDLMTLLRQIVPQLASMHHAGLKHSGAHPRNFLWKRNEDGALKLTWIDLATVGRCSPYDRKHIAMDMSDLLEYFDLEDGELAALQELYRSVHDIPVVFRHTGKTTGKMVVCEYR